ncbi:uncharacterized protein LOC113765900 [Coffea eugenioides]|uniref:uncharacterized protein LOC113765900 n=1 Tax=Coffea eugenioides TaxID=49369 RepID=UPI000F60AE47|nr:uncharacterized protein LOC113765900 [Coffea eugenioides]
MDRRLAVPSGRLAVSRRAHALTKILLSSIKRQWSEDHVLQARRPPHTAIIAACRHLPSLSAAAAPSSSRDPPDLVTHDQVARTSSRHPLCQAHGPPSKPRAHPVARFCSSRQLTQLTQASSSARDPESAALAVRILERPSNPARATYLRVCSSRVFPLSQQPISRPATPSSSTARAACPVQLPRAFVTQRSRRGAPPSGSFSPSPCITSTASSSVAQKLKVVKTVGPSGSQPRKRRAPVQPPIRSRLGLNKSTMSPEEWGEPVTNLTRAQQDRFNSLVHCPFAPLRIPLHPEHILTVLVTTPNRSLLSILTSGGSSPRIGNFTIRVSPMPLI